MPSKFTFTVICTCLWQRKSSLALSEDGCVHLRLNLVPGLALPDRCAMLPVLCFFFKLGSLQNKPSIPADLDFSGKISSLSFCPLFYTYFVCMMIAWGQAWSLTSLPPYCVLAALWIPNPGMLVRWLRLRGGWSFSWNLRAWEFQGRSICPHFASTMKLCCDPAQQMSGGASSCRSLCMLARIYYVQAAVYKSSQWAYFIATSFIFRA